MNMQFIRDNYRVPAKRGGRIAFTCCATCGLRLGTIVAAQGKYLRVRFDEDHGAGRPSTIHPKWNVDYLGGAA